MKNDLHFFIQARISSTRLPEKVLLPFYESESILKIIVEKLKSHFPHIPLVVCTSTALSDNRIENFCRQNQVNYFRGEENNVLQRFIDAAKVHQAKTIVRICADNPFLDVEFLKDIINEYHLFPDADYWSFKNSDNVPVIKTHFGFFAEIVTFEALNKVNRLTSKSLYLEHVTNYIYSHKEFICNLKMLPNELENRRDLRFTIDDEDDFEAMKTVYAYYKKENYNLNKTIQFVDNHKEIKDKMVLNIEKYSK